MRKGILFCGSLIVDLLKTVEVYPREGMLSTIKSITISTGGLVNNNALNLRHLDRDLPVGAMGQVGQDEYGRLILRTLRDHGVDTSRIVQDPSLGTAFTDVITVSGTGVRTFFYFGGANATWGQDELPWEGLAEKYDLVQLGYLLLLDTMDAPDPIHGTKAAAVLAKFRALGLQTSVDLVSEDSQRFAAVVTPALKHVDHLIINELEAERITGVRTRTEDGRFLPEATAEAVRQLFRLGVRCTVVIHAPEGAVGLAAGDGALIVQPSHLVEPWEIKSTVGAGDAFCSGVLYGLKEGWDLAAAMKLGNAMGAMSLFDLTTSGGAKPLSVVREFMRNREYRRLE